MLIFFTSSDDFLLVIIGKIKNRTRISATPARSSLPYDQDRIQQNASPQTIKKWNATPHKFWTCACNHTHLELCQKVLWKWIQCRQLFPRTAMPYPISKLMQRSIDSLPSHIRAIVGFFQVMKRNNWFVLNPIALICLKMYNRIGVRKFVTWIWFKNVVLCI